MRVLVFELSPSGHRFQYAATVISAASELATEVVFATTEEASKSTAFQEFLKPVSDRFVLDVTSKDSSGSPLARAARNYSCFRQVVKKHRPDHLYVPTADGFSQVLGISNKLGFRVVGKEMELEILLMGGHRYFQSNGWKSRLSRRWWMTALQASDASVIHVLDPWLRKKIAASSNTLPFKESLRDIPEPVEPIHVTAQGEAKDQLGLSRASRFLGFFGGANLRKGADLMLNAFANSPLQTEDRLLLMGRIEEPIRTMLQEKYASLVSRGRIVLFDRFVSQAELELGLSAVDVICVPYPLQFGSSGFVVRAASVHKHLLTANHGWIGNMVNRFELGSTCDVRDPLAFSRAISTSLEAAEHFCVSTKSEEFTSYHTLANTQSHWTKRLRERLGVQSNIKLTELPKNVFFGLLR